MLRLGPPRYIKSIVSYRREKQFASLLRPNHSKSKFNNQYTNGTVKIHFFMHHKKGSNAQILQPSSH